MCPVPVPRVVNPVRLCVIYPGKNGRDSLPLLDDIRDVKLDCVLVTHFHSDHCVTLPYLVTRTGPDEVAAPDFHDTAGVDALRVHDKDTLSHKAMRSNFGMAAAARSRIDLSITEAFENESGKSVWCQLYEEVDVSRANAPIKVIEVLTRPRSIAASVSHASTHDTCSDGVHVPGRGRREACVIHRGLLVPGGPPPDGRAKVPAVPNVDVLIVESTCGINNHDPREAREGLPHRCPQLHRQVGSGKYLIPMFAFLVCGHFSVEHWTQQHSELADVPFSGSAAVW